MDAVPADESATSTVHCCTAPPGSRQQQEARSASEGEATPGVTRHGRRVTPSPQLDGTTPVAARAEVTWSAATAFPCLGMARRWSGRLPDTGPTVSLCL